LTIRIGNGLLPLNLLVLGLVVAILFFPSNVLRIVLGLPFVLFFPGYTLVSALFPKREGMSGIERVALSLGVSIAIVPIIGLILNYTIWGIGLESVLYSIVSFILISSIIGWFRGKRLTEQERFNVEFQLGVPRWSGGAWNRTLSIILIIAILVALGTLGYFMAKPKVGEGFTEFYILGLNGKAADYPKEIRLGNEEKVIVGIVNLEHEVVSYRVEIKIDGVKNNEAGPVVLANEQKWEEIVSFMPDKSGDSQEVEFLLYKNEETEPYLKPLHLWVNVTEEKENDKSNNLTTRYESTHTT